MINSYDLSVKKKKIIIFMVCERDGWMAWLRQFCSVDAETGECVVRVCESCSAPIHVIVVHQLIAIPPLSSDVISAPNAPIPSATRRVWNIQENINNEILNLKKFLFVVM